MSATRSLASYVSNLKYEDLPPLVVEKGKLQILDALGNAIGGYPLSLSKTFLGMAKDLGGGSEEATLIGDGTKVSVPLAAFGNGALATMLDYDAHVGSLAVPGALAAGEASGISGKELITSVVAGYECIARIFSSMEVTQRHERSINGGTVEVFASAAGTGRALGLGDDEMLSALGMAGIYTPVPAGYKWLGDEGLRPRKDIKQGWAWICMTGTFAAVSAQRGLKMLQENNILDGEKGLWRILGKDGFKEEALTAGYGETYHILQFNSKLWPGCGMTHSAMMGVTSLVKDNSVPVSDIERIEVITNRAMGVGFDDQEPAGACNLQFSIPYQVSAALIAGDRGPNWYSDKVAKSPEVADMAKRVFLSFDEECNQAMRNGQVLMAKVAVLTKSGQRYSSRVDEWELARNVDEVRNKFTATASQVTDAKQVDQILSTVDNLESVGNVSELADQLRIPATRG